MTRVDYGRVAVFLVRAVVLYYAMRILRALSEFLAHHSASLLSGFTYLAINFLVMLFALYCLFLRGPDILRQLRLLSSLRSEPEDMIMEKFGGIAQATFAGALATAAIQGTVGGLAFLFFGLPAPLLWGTEVGRAIDEG
jgi:predicted PurR-regulated permease PerM